LKHQFGFLPLSLSFVNFGWREDTLECWDDAAVTAEALDFDLVQAK
jgi:hypothetical protein